MTGSTALGEALDPEDLRALLARYYAIAREVVEGFGGTLEKFIGDAVMAVFGLPTAHGDDPERALGAALELRDRVRADAALGERLPIRLGVASGEVVASREATAGGDFLITGDAVNVAARLQQAAEPWAILAAERTAHAAHGFVFGAAEAVAAKGKVEPIPAAMLLGRSEQPTRHVARVPLFGRAADLAQLELVMGRVVAERRPFLVSLVAPAGTGKTRLLEELLDRLPSLAPGAEVAIAQCLPYGQRLTYWPLRAVLHRLARIDEDAPPAFIRRGLTAWLAELGDEDPARDAELLAATIGAGEAEIGEPTALFGAWKTAIELAAARLPLVIVFEDLHWSSDSLLDLVEAILQPRGDLPLLMIALTRPELLDRRPRWGGGRRDFISLALEPLGDGAVAELVHHLLEGASPELVAAVVGRAEGNPFFAGEIVRSLTDRLGPNGVAATDAAELLATLPDTVQATVLARLDQLPPDERRVLQVGAVFGRSFRPSGVGAVEPALGDRADAAVALLLERDLVRPSGADGYTFRHILIREVAYQTLPRAERARLHGAAAAWLEARAAGREEAYAELIAYHYREAAVLGTALDPAAAEAIRLRAVAWLRRAGDVAFSAGALAEAGHHLDAAIELAPTEQLPDLYERLGDFFIDGPRAITAYQEGLRVAKEQGRPIDQVARLVAGLLTVHTRYHGAVPQRPPEAEMHALLAEAERLTDEVSDDRVRARLLIARCFYPFFLGAEGLPVTEAELATSELTARRGLALAERLDEPELVSAGLDALTSLAQDRGRYRDALGYAERRLPLVDRLGLLELLDAESMVAWSSIAVGDLRRAVEVSGNRLAVLQPGQASGWALHLTAHRTNALAQLGRWDEALAAARHAKRLWLEVNRGPVGYAMVGFLAGLLVARARRDEAAEDEMVEPIRAILHRFAPNPRNTVARQVLEEDPHPDAAALESATVIRPDVAERVLSSWNDRRLALPGATLSALADWAAAGEMVPLLAQVRRAQGLASGDPGPLAEALSIFERIGASPGIARAQWELGSRTRDERLLRQGLATLRELGDLEQLDRYEAAAG